MKSLLLAASFLAVLGAGAAYAEDVVTVYSADGLHDGSPNWYQTEFDAFTKATGIKVQYVEGGSGVVVERVAKEKSNPQADVLVTLPPFIQKAAADGLLQPYTPAGADQILASEKDPNGTYYALVDNYTSFIYNTKALGTAPSKLRRSAGSEVQGQDPVFDPRPGRRRHGGHAADQPGLRRQGGRLRLSSEAAGQQPRPVLLHRQADGAGQQGRALGGQWRSADEHRPDGRQPEHPGLLAGRAGRRAHGAVPAVLHRPGAGRAPCRCRQEADRLPAEPGCADARSAPSPRACPPART